MSGYRNLHREQIESTAIWDVATSPLLLSTTKRDGCYRIWTASADGLVRLYYVHEKTVEEKQQSSVLDASALSMTCTHILLGSTQKPQQAGISALGCTTVCAERNYVGEDDTAGDLVVASLGMSGVVRIWSFSENADADVVLSDNQPQKEVKCLQEFTVENATGTVMMICPPRVWTTAGTTDLCVAVACLDGTVAQVATGIATPSRVPDQKEKEPTAAGTVLDRRGSQGSAVPLSIASHPKAPVVAVGRQDGQIDILTSSSSSTLQQTTADDARHRRHRLRLPGHDIGRDNNNSGLAIRAAAYTPDGNMLCAGNDAGALAVWDVNRPVSPMLAHYVQTAHASWILDLVALPDSERFVTCGADRKMHVWKLDQMYQPVHSFDSDQTVWTMAVQSRGHGAFDKNKTRATLRMAAGTETGRMQVLSLD
ncbi:WD domain, G-beta repeat [Seminavis robusta]|uniref:WD domain, G-beta repeat n=1 Tax=Seminavis robusta TaxID=568900 RepID=A0A9N8EFQ4_9STRA|nr:WD domain, G-beta repeat [Seminavis robusta]|eukprot:Sro869_g213480.1 WD domain, G-beta repeat (425) ;mRNA; f:25498-26772